MAKSLTALLRAHFGKDPSKLPVVETLFGFHERPNLHLALQDLLDRPERKSRLTGIILSEHYETVSLSKLSKPNSAKPFEEGPVEYADVAIGPDRKLACVKRGLYLFKREGSPAALLVSEQQYAR